MALLGGRARRGAARPEEAASKPEEIIAQSEAPAERAVTLEYLKTIVGEAVARAEEGRKKIEDVNAFIASRVRAYREELTAEEQTKLGAIVAEASARLRALEEKAAIILLESDTGSAQPVTPDQILSEETVVPPARVPKSTLAAEPEIPFDDPVVIQSAPEAAPAVPEIRVEMRPAQTVRELLNIAKVRRNAESPVRVSVLDQVRYAEQRGIYENKELAGQLEAVVRTMFGGEQRNDIRAIAAEVGIPIEQVQEIADRQRAALEDRARREVQQESQAGVKKVLAKGVAYAGLGALLQRVGGVGWLTAPIRMVEAWRQGNVQEKKVQARIAELEQQLASADPASEEAALGREVLSNVAAEIALVKQQQIDGQRDLSDTEAQADALRHDVVRFLEQTRPELSPEQRLQMSRAASALFSVDQANAALEFQVSSQEPNAFRKLMTTMDKLLGSKILRGGETGKERALTVGVFAAAGVLAREVPIVRNILFGYTGMKAGEFAANMITKRAGRYEVLKPVSSAQLAAEDVPKDVIDRARVQLLDGKLRRENPAEYQKIRELLDRHEEQLYAGAEKATDYIDERNAALEQGLADRTKIANEKKVVVNGARVAGAILGAALGPMAVGWIAEKFRPTEAAAAPAAEVAPVPEVAGPEVAPPTPETDPRILELAMIRKDDGFTDVMARQLLARGAEGHPPMALDDILGLSRREFPSWAVAEAKRLAIDSGFLNPDGRVTEFGLKAGSGGIILRPEGFEFIGDPQAMAYHVGRPLGVETPTPAATVGTLSTEGSSLTPAERVAWETAHPGAKVVEVGGGAPAAVAEAAATPAPAEAPPAAAPAETVVGAGGVEVGHTPAWVSKFEDVFRGTHSTEERLIALRTSLSGDKIVKVDGGTMQFKLEDGASVWSKDSGVTFEAVDDRVVEEFVRRQAALDATEHDIRGGSDVEFDF